MVIIVAFGLNICEGLFLGGGGIWIIFKHLYLNDNSEFDSKISYLMFLHDYLLACEISTVTTQILKLNLSLRKIYLSWEKNRTFIANIFIFMLVQRQVSTLLVLGQFLLVPDNRTVFNVNPCPIYTGAAAGSRVRSIWSTSGSRWFCFL